jgi:nucleotide-binding universal stress UspA family protein
LSAQNETLSLSQEVPAVFLSRLLVATDGSENGEGAVSFALTLARRHGSDVEFCYAVDRTAAIAECCSADGGSDTILPLIESLDEMAHAILEKARDRATAAGVTATISVLDGNAPGAIVDRQQTRGADAIVIGTKGKRGLERFVMGSTADGVLRRADVPVFVVPPGARETSATFERLLVAVDDSDPSDAATAFAITFAEAERSRLVFCGVVETKYLEDKGALFAFDPAPLLVEFRESIEGLVTNAADRARESDVASEWLIADGEPGAVIPKIAATQRAGAIVIGTHGRRGLRRWLVGSVAESVVQHSSVPVVVVRGTRHERAPEILA